MPDIHIVREHHLGLAGARKLAFQWAEHAEHKLGLECTYEEGKTKDKVTFTRTGVKGELHVGKDRFELDAKLGLLLGAFRERIESEIVKNLDFLLAHKEPHKAFDSAMERHARGEHAAPAKARPKKKA